MQGCVRKHHAELRHVRGDGCGDLRSGPARRQHDRPRARDEQRPRTLPQLDEHPRGRLVACHQREGAILAALARAQLAHRALVGRSAGQVVAADALHGEDRAVGQAPGCELDGVRPSGTRSECHLAAGVQQRHPRPAGRTRVGLRMEAAVAGIVVFALAGGAHRECRHRREGPVVRDALHDREARAAVGAVHERVAVAAVGRILQLGQAVVAGGGVRRDERVRVAARDALDDAEVALPGRLDGGPVDALDDRERRRLARQPRQEALDRGGPAVDLEHDPALVVEHEPPELLLAREAVDEGAKADPLHDPLHARAHARRRHGRSSSTSSRSRCEAVACASWMRGMCCERLTMR